MDTHLYLLSGSAPTGTYLASNGDYQGLTNSYIRQSLHQGWYTVVATNYGKTLKTGDYRLRVQDASVCSSVTHIHPTETIKYGSWNVSDCESPRRPGRYADYYSFTVEGSANRLVTIDLKSSTDTWLHLLDVAATSGTAYLHSDDDGGDVGYNSKLSVSLVRGHTPSRLPPSVPGPPGATP